MPIPRDSAFQALSQVGDVPSMPRSEAEPKGAVVSAANARA
jgi:hypothetical protein